MNKKKVMLNVLLVVCILVFVGSGVYLFRYYYAAHETQNELDELIALKEEGQQEADAGTDTVEQSGPEPEENAEGIKKTIQQKQRYMRLAPGREHEDRLSGYAYAGGFGVLPSPEF